MGRGVAEGMMTEGDGDGEGAWAKVGLAEGIGVVRTTTGGPEDDVVCDVAVWEHAVRTAATTRATIPTLTFPHRAGGNMSDGRFTPTPSADGEVGGPFCQ